MKSKVKSSKKFKTVDLAYVALGAVLGWCVIPFIIPDIIKLGLALVLSRRLSPVLKLQ